MPEVYLTTFSVWTCRFKIVSEGKMKKDDLKLSNIVRMDEFKPEIGKSPFIGSRRAPVIRTPDRKLWWSCSLCGTPHRYLGGCWSFFGNLEPHLSMNFLSPYLHNNYHISFYCARILHDNWFMNNSEIENIIICQLLFMNTVEWCENVC